MGAEEVLLEHSHRGFALAARIARANLPSAATSRSLRWRRRTGLVVDPFDPMTIAIRLRGAVGTGLHPVGAATSASGSSHRFPIAPCRSRSRFSMQSAPVNIPATTHPPWPPRSARAHAAGRRAGRGGRRGLRQLITGTRLAAPIRFGSSKTTERLCRCFHLQDVPSDRPVSSIWLLLSGSDTRLWFPSGCFGPVCECMVPWELW